MKLDLLLTKVNVSEIINSKEIDIKGVSSNSKEIKENYIFVCINGFSDNGHRYIEEAVEKGAKVVVISEDVLFNDGITTIVKVKDTRKALSILCANFNSHPAEKMKLIGITGTNGKTGTTYLLKNILEKAGYKVGLIGTNVNLIGNSVFPAKRTTPDAPELSSLLSEMVRSGVDYAVMEVSSHSLILNRVYGIKFDVGILTNITKDHLDFHKTMEAYAEAKALLFENSEISVLNADDEYFDFIKSKSKGEIVTYGVKNGADINAENTVISENGISYIAKYKNECEAFYIPLSGSFYVYNSLCAAAAAKALGIPLAFSGRCFKNQKPVEGRCEKVKLPHNEFSIIIDYAHTPDGLINILKSVNEMKKNRVITLFGCGGDRDKTKRPEMGKIASENSDFVIITSDNPRSENPDKIIENIVSGIEKNNYTVIPDRKRAIYFGISICEKGDILLLAGKGHENYQVLESGKIHFDEREVIREYYAENK